MEAPLWIDMALTYLGREPVESGRTIESCGLKGGSSYGLDLFQHVQHLGDLNSHVTPFLSGFCGVARHISLVGGNCNWGALLP